MRRAITLLGLAGLLAVTGCSTSASSGSTSASSGSTSASSGSTSASYGSTSAGSTSAGSSSARSTSAGGTTTSASTGTPASAPASASPSPHPGAVPPVSKRARGAGLVDVRTAVPDAVIDLRYATTHNFTHVRLYPTRARCLVHRSMVRGLTIAARRLRARGLVLVFWDCYRPHAVQVRMFKIVPDPNWVARPGPYATSHEAGRSVDVTLARARVGGTCATHVRGHCLLSMATGFDDFTPRAWADATKGVSATARHDRATLRHAMTSGGLSVYSGEWWHFDGPGSKVHRPHLHAPVY